MSIFDLIFFTIVVYGLAWLITKSEAFGWFRWAVERIPIVGKLVTCIVCSAIWIGALLAIFASGGTLISQQLAASCVLDVVVVCGWIAGTVWPMARLLRDAD
jgi:hypothetical protein